MHISETFHSDYTYRTVNNENCMELTNQRRHGPDITLQLKCVFTSYILHLTVFTVSLPLTVTYCETSLDKGNDPLHGLWYDWQSDQQYRECRFLLRIAEIGFDQTKATVTSSYGDIHARMLKTIRPDVISSILVYQLYIFFGGGGNSPPVGQGLLSHEVSRSHTTTHHSR